MALPTREDTASIAVYMLGLGSRGSIEEGLYVMYMLHKVKSIITMLILPNV